MASSSGFLAKSIVLLALLFIAVGASLHFGRQLGKSIMDMTRSSIEEKVGSVATAEGETDDEGYMLDVVGTRSGFGYEPEEFGQSRFPREWADPVEDEFEAGDEEPEVIINLLDQEQEDVDENGEGESRTDGETEEDGETTDNRDTIFNLGSEETYRIQVGSYEERTNAESVWRRLTQAGFDASVSAFNSEDKVQYRVVVGSYNSREDADKDAERLRALNFDAWVYQVR